MTNNEIVQNSKSETKNSHFLYIFKFGISCLNQDRSCSYASSMYFIKCKLCCYNTRTFSRQSMNSCTQFYALIQIIFRSQRKNIDYYYYLLLSFLCTAIHSQRLSADFPVSFCTNLKSKGCWGRENILLVRGTIQFQYQIVKHKIPAINQFSKLEANNIICNIKVI